MNFILTIAVAFGAQFIAIGAYASDTAQLQILNENLQPVVGADVLIGASEGGETLKTDLNGAITIPSSWKTSLPVTITAAGYMKSTFLDVSPAETSLQLHREDQKGLMEVKGKTTNYDNLKKDGKVDFSLVYPGLRLRQLSQFNVESVMSADSDIMKVMTETIAIPSNLSIPEQKESYVLPITLDKSTYRMSFKQPGDYRLMAMHGQFPISQVVGELRNGKSFYEVINFFRILGGGQKDLTLSGATEGQDIPVNQLNFNKTVTVKGIPLTADQVMFSFSMAKQADLFFPTDIKRIYPADTTQLAVPGDSEQNSVVSLLMPNSEAKKIGGSSVDKKSLNDDSVAEEFKSLFDGMLKLFNISFGDKDKSENAGPGGLSSARHSENEVSPTFLSLIARPTLNENKITLAPPPTVAGIEPVATYAILSEIERTPKGDYTVEHRFRIWEVSQMGWTGELHLPAYTNSLTPGKKYRWEVLFMGRSTSHNNSGEYFLDGVTHVTRNTIDF